MSSSHLSQGAQVLAAMAAIAIVLLWLSLRIRRRERLVRDLPMSKVQGVFIGLVELEVTAESEKPLTSFLGGQVCVQYSYHIDEHWSRTVSEAYTDDKGNAQTRNRTEEGWKTIAAGGAAEPFYGRDDTGVILIRPDGAKFEGVGFFDRTVTRGDPLYNTKATPIAVPDSTGRRRFVEEGVPLHAPVFVVGQARERDDVVAPEIAASKGAAMFLISTRSKRGVEVSYAVYSWLGLGRRPCRFRGGGLPGGAGAPPQVGARRGRAGALLRLPRSLGRGVVAHGLQQPGRAARARPPGLVPCRG